LLSAPNVAKQIRVESASLGVRRWGARLLSELVGISQTSPSGDAAFLRLYVPAQYRRRGIGRAILSTVWAESGVARLRAVVNAGEAGDRFAAVMGARVVMRLVVMSQPLSEIDLGEVRLAEGYQLVVWCGQAPDSLVGSYAAAKRHIGDAPDAHRQVDAASWDVARVREWEQVVRAQGHTLWVCAALRDGAVVAFTEVEAGASPAASQTDTAVLPSHRGNGLATWVKTELARQLRTYRPHITSVISTINADNRPMIAVNQRLGYRIARERLLVEADASAVAIR
jgi:GNAT superfamily N-acetyltransferase